MIPFLNSCTYVLKLLTYCALQYVKKPSKLSLRDRYHHEFLDDLSAETFSAYSVVTLRSSSTLERMDSRGMR